MTVFAADLLAGKVALITGGGTGLGLAMARSFGACGAKLVIASRSDENVENGAKALRDAGVNQQDKVAIYLYNCPEYLEAMYGAFKISLVPVNTNYRYEADELVYLWDNSEQSRKVPHATRHVYN